MPLTCQCNWEIDSVPGEWWYLNTNDVDFYKFKKFKSMRCQSCRKLISFGNLCMEFKRVRYPYTVIEAKIYGDTIFDLNYEPYIPASPHFICESCGEIFMNLKAIGYDCISPNENLPKLLEEYHLLSGFKRSNYAEKN